MVIKPSSENADKFLLRNGNSFLMELHLCTIYFKISTFYRFFSSSNSQKYSLRHPLKALPFTFLSLFCLGLYLLLQERERGLGWWSVPFLDLQCPLHLLSRREPSSSSGPNIHINVVRLLYSGYSVFYIFYQLPVATDQHPLLHLPELGAFSLPFS